jgi:hypothetical protein
MRHPVGSGEAVADPEPTLPLEQVLSEHAGE